MGYRLEIVDVSNVNGDVSTQQPILCVDESGTTSWRDAKKALRQWYLDQAKALRDVSERDMFPK